MAWSSLGTVSLSWDTAWFAPAIRGDVLIRLTQSYAPKEVTRINRMFLWERYPSGDERFLRAFYPSNKPSLVPLTVPQPMKDAGWLEREIGVKHGWAGVVIQANWQCSCDLFAVESSLTVDWRITEVWDTGYAAELLIYNPSTEPISEWSIPFTADNVTDVWGAELEALGADNWEVSPSLTTGNPTIFPGETRVVGIVAEGSPDFLNLTVPPNPPISDGGEY